MDGTQVMAFSLKQVAPSVERALAAAGLAIGEVDHVILHQANAMMIKTLGHKIKARDDQMVYAVKDFGNTSSTSIPLAVCDHLTRHPATGDLTFLLCGFGVGWSWSTAVWRTPGAGGPRYYPRAMTLFIRTQASAQVGMGHFMRCFAIAEAARRRDIPVTFLLNDLDAATAMRMASIGADGQAMSVPVAGVGDLEAMVFAAADWLLIDSYDATAAYLKALKGRVRTVVLDDLNALDFFACDLLVNPAQSAPAMGYEAKTGARCLLGPAYALIREEFLRPHPPSTEGPSIVVMFGGSDPTGLTAAVAERLHDALAWCHRQDYRRSCQYAYKCSESAEKAATEYAFIHLSIPCG
ncbi:MAG: 3-oxoacyl-[acyl-carrier-protein] synthase III C-terminal domain-containing protein [Asticcacaulis sp.]